jgi:hypothetical protein
MLGAIAEFILRRTRVPDVVWLVGAGILARPECNVWLANAALTQQDMNLAVHKDSSAWLSLRQKDGSHDQ